MDDDAVAARLEQLGLSEKEIDTYLTILEHGEAKASTIAADAGVSTRYVYSVSETLAARGFVEVNDHAVPATIRANPPEDVIGDLTDDLETLESELTQRFGGAPESLQEFEVIKTRTTMQKRIEERLDGAEEEVMLTLPAGLADELDARLRDAVDRGVLVLLIVTGVDDGDDGRFDGLGSVVRTLKEGAPAILAIDRRYSLFAPYEMLVTSSAEANAVAIAQEQLAPIVVGSFFGNYWPIADEAYVADPPALPRTHPCFRHAVKHATHCLEADREIRVTGEVRPDRTTDLRTIEGRLAGVRQSLVEPTNADFPVENTMILEVDGETVTIGGEGAFVEDYEAGAITLAAADDS